MVINILSFVFAIIGIFVAGIPCGIAAIVLGIIGLATHRSLKGFGVAGIIIGVIDIVIVVACVILVVMGLLIA